MVPLFRETLSHGIVIAAQSAADAERFHSIGASPARTHVTGNIKFDYQQPPEVAARGARWREAQAAGRPVWVAGSTHDGEETILLDAHRRLLATRPHALLLLAPRHPQRFEAVRDLLAKRGFGYVQRSTGAPVRDSTAVLLVDTLGELMSFYAAADVAFVGGSLVPIGGHNLLEPASLGVPILVGPDNSSGAEIARLLIARGAAEVVSDAATLAERLDALLAQPALRQRMGAAGREAVEDNRGALDKLLELIEPLLADR
jgi:3-deoxy-D-manno-octulosonic-acid transferase